MVQSYDLSSVTWEGPAAEKQTQEAKKRDVDIIRGGQEVKEAGAKLPYVGPTAETELTGKKLGNILDIKKYGVDLRAKFGSEKPVENYREGMRYYTTALTTPHNSAGDQDLVTLAAKIQDPTGAVMQGDIDRYNNIQVALEKIPQQFANEFRQTGKFSEKTRRDIRQFLANRVVIMRDAYNDMRQSYEADINDLNAQAGDTKTPPLDVKTILGTHPADLYGDRIRAYAADLRKAGDDAAAETADALIGAPAGTRVAGEDIKGFRFSPRAEAEIIEYFRSPEATAEGYGQKLAEVAVREGLIDEKEAQGYAQRAAAENAKIFEQTPEQRAAIDAVNYADIDRAATENAGLLESVAQMGRNLPESAAQIATGAGQLTADVLSSIFSGERQGSVKTFTDLAGALLQGDTDDPTVQAAAQVLEENYGGMDNLKRYVVRDPLAAASDISLLFGVAGGGAKLARLPNAAEAFSTAQRWTDPLGGMVTAVTKGVPAVAGSKAAEKTGEIASEVVAFPSGIGGETLRQAMGAGFDRGRTGAPTPRSEAFMAGLTSPEATAETAVEAAQSLLSGIRESASQAYTDAMQSFGRTPTPLDIGKVQQRVQSLKPKSYDTWSARKGERPADHIAWEKMNGFVEEYAQKAAQDPTLLLPLQMDQFKRDVYDIGSKINGAFDSNAGRIARKTYNAVRQELVRHDPVYADIMRDYEKAMNETQQMERSLSLGNRTGIETASRKLQSIYRNNVNTGYGARTAQFDRLTEADADGELRALLAGQSGSSITPRGINRVAAALPFAAPALTSVSLPMALATAPLFSPAAVSATAYGAGRLAGTGKRALDAVTGSDIATKAADLYSKYPAAALGVTQAGTMLENIGAEELQARYGAPAVSQTEDIPIIEGVAPEDVIRVTGTRAPIDLGTEGTYDPATDTYVLPDGTRVDASGQPIEMAHGGRVAMKRGGSARDRARSFAKGAMFAFNDEAEAGLRALMQLDPSAYRREVAKIRMQQKMYEDAHPIESLAFEGAGSVVPAFIPGGQIASAGRLGSLAARAPMVVRRAAPVVRDAALYGAGSAENVRDIPRAMGEEAAVGLGLYGAGRLAARPAKAGYRKVRSIFR